MVKYLVKDDKLAELVKDEILQKEIPKECYHQDNKIFIIKKAK
jgi:hypothetical protein